MKTTTCTFNKSNWSGEEATIEVTEFAGGFSWEQNGYEISLRNRQSYDGGDELFVSYDIYVDGERTDNKVGASFHVDGAAAMWEATNWDGSMTRHGKNAAIAASRLEFNLL